MSETPAHTKSTKARSRLSFGNMAANMSFVAGTAPCWRVIGNRAALWCCAFLTSVRRKRSTTTRNISPSRRCGNGCPRPTWSWSRECDRIKRGWPLACDVPGGPGHPACGVGRDGSGIPRSLSRPLAFRLGNGPHRAFHLQWTGILISVLRSERSYGNVAPRVSLFSRCLHEAVRRLHRGQHHGDPHTQQHLRIADGDSDLLPGEASA